MKYRLEDIHNSSKTALEGADRLGGGSKYMDIYRSSKFGKYMPESIGAVDAEIAKLEAEIAAAETEIIE